MITSIISHLAAAIAPLLLIFLVTCVSRRMQNARYRRDFWNRQSIDALRKIRFWDIKGLPATPKIITDINCLQIVQQTIALSQKFGLFELLAEHPGSTVEIIAKHLGLSLRHTRAVIEILFASEIIGQHFKGYALTEKAQVYLLKASPFFVPLPPPFLTKRFLKSLRNSTAKRVIEKWRRGKSCTPELFAMQQHVHSFPLGFALHKSGLLNNANKIVDVAGGAGSLVIGLALTNQSLECHIIELPGSIRVIEKMISNYGLTGRINCIGMDMFVDDWPENFDAVLFTNIFHDWDKNLCDVLAQKAFKALRPGGKVILQEALLYDDKPGPLWTAHWSMNVALYTHGQQFHADELKDILEAAGFEDVQTHPLLGYYSSVVAVKSRTHSE